AQKKVESRNFDMRKQLLEYDDVANDQRRVIYEQRNEILAADEVADAVAGIRQEVLDEAISDFVPPQSLPEQWDLPGLQDHLRVEFNLEAPVVQWAEEDERFHEEQLRERLQALHLETYQAKVAEAGEALMRRFEKQVMLQVLDTRWKEHLQSMDHLRRGIHLRGYAQKNPKQEYKRESFELFQSLLANIKADVTRILSHVQVRRPEEVDELERQRREALERETATAASRHEDPDPDTAEAQAAPLPGADGRPVRREGPKVGRNDACPCGSGKKYKQCCGKLS
ncbi:MAG: SEC-C metal-binding domain-containing protein, partial [Halomonas sp.]